jgi:hypothetical protein
LGEGVLERGEGELDWFGDLTIDCKEIAVFVVFFDWTCCMHTYVKDLYRDVVRQNVKRTVVPAVNEFLWGVFELH